MQPANYHFLKAVCWGTFFGGGVWLFLTIPAAIFVLLDGDIAPALVIAASPLLISGVGTLAGMILVGLPATFVLSNLHRESSSAYGLIGGLAGFLLPGVTVALVESDVSSMMEASAFLGLFGAVAVITAATIWGNWREQLAQTAPPEGADRDEGKWLV